LSEAAAAKAAAECGEEKRWRCGTTRAMRGILFGGMHFHHRRRGRFFYAPKKTKKKDEEEDGE